MLKRFIGDALTYTAGNILVRGVSIVLVPFYTRVLTPGDYGALDMLTVLAGLINVTVALEITQGLARRRRKLAALRRRRCGLHSVRTPYSSSSECWPLRGLRA